jgi:hypothetical protein
MIASDRRDDVAFQDKIKREFSIALIDGAVVDVASGGQHEASRLIFIFVIVTGGMVVVANGQENPYRKLDGEIRSSAR